MSTAPSKKVSQKLISLVVGLFAKLMVSWLEKSDAPYIPKLKTPSPAEAGKEDFRFIANAYFFSSTSSKSTSVTSSLAVLPPALPAA